MARCIEKTLSGNRCKNEAEEGRKYCAIHPRGDGLDELDENGCMTQAALARYLGVTSERVRQYRVSGIIKMTPDGKYEFEEAIAALAAHGDSSKSNTKRRLFKSGEGRKPDLEAGPDDSLNEQHLKAKIVYQRERARLARIKADEAESLVVDRDEVKMDVYGAFRIARNMILNIPDRVSAQLAGMHDKRDIHRALSTELGRCMNELADRIEAYAGADEDEDAGDE